MSICIACGLNWIGSLWTWLVETFSEALITCLRNHIWILYIDPLMVPMMEHQEVCCLKLHLRESVVDPSEGSLLVPMMAHYRVPYTWGVWMLGRLMGPFWGLLKDGFWGGVASIPQMWQKLWEDLWRVWKCGCSASFYARWGGTSRSRESPSSYRPIWQWRCGSKTVSEEARRNFKYDLLHSPLSRTI